MLHSNVSCLFGSLRGRLTHHGNSTIFTAEPIMIMWPWCKSTVGRHNRIASEHRIRTNRTMYERCMRPLLFRFPHCTGAPLQNRNGQPRDQLRSNLLYLLWYMLLRNLDWLEQLFWFYSLRERPLMTSDIRVGRGVQDSPQNRTL